MPNPQHTQTTIEVYFHDDHEFEDTCFVADRLCERSVDRAFLTDLSNRYAIHGMKAALTREEAGQLLDIATFQRPAV